VLLNHAFFNYLHCYFYLLIFYILGVSENPYFSQLPYRRIGVSVSSIGASLMAMALQDAMAVVVAAGTLLVD